jgi:cobalt-zinc-cadmium resistance protein CzcA
MPFPTFPTQVKVILKAPGMTPEEVESRVIAPIEQEMLGIPHQTILRSVAKYAIADVTINFDDSTDVYWARNQVNERLTGVMGNLPSTVTGGMAPISTPLSDMYMFTLEGPQSLAEKRRVLDWVVRPALRTVPGVADVNALGGMAETYEVAPDMQALAAAGLSVEDLASAINAGNRNDGAGRLPTGEEALIVRATGAIRTLDDLRPWWWRWAPVCCAWAMWPMRIGALTRYGAVTRNGKGEAVEGWSSRCAGRMRPRWSMA